MEIALVAFLKLNRTFYCRNHQKAGKSLNSGDLCLHSRRRKGCSKQLRGIRLDIETHTRPFLVFIMVAQQVDFFNVFWMRFHALYQMVLWFGPCADFSFVRSSNAVGQLYDLTFLGPITLTATLISLKFAFWVEARGRKNQTIHKVALPCT